MALAIEECRTASIKDHSGQDVNLIWHKHRAPDRDTVPPFPFQIYILQSARQCVANPEELGRALCLHLEQEVVVPHPSFRIQMDADCQHRLEIYHSDTFINALSCVEHQRKEVAWRNRNGIWPRLVDRWDHDTGSRGEQCQGLITVIDSDSWQEEGVLLVSFDPLRYWGPKVQRSWNFAGHEPAIVRATRKFIDHRPYHETLQGALLYAWQCAGDVWTQRDLARRNDGGFSPALYPAVDPAAHEDADAETDDEESAVIALPMPAFGPNGGEDEDDHDLPTIKNTFDMDELWVLPTACTPRYQMATYSDLSGLHTVSVWDKKYSLNRPSFAYTLYSGPRATFAAESLFHCLNKGLLADIPWTLDVKRGFDTMSEAFEHHRAEWYRREETSVQKRHDCMQMILSKINRKRLPIELLDYIVEVLVPPTIPDYSGGFTRPFHSVFLYFDPAYATQKCFAAAHGPLVVYSQPSSLHEEHLLVRFLRFWHRVADEMHTIWSLAAPRSVPPGITSLPKLKLRPLNIEAQFSLTSPKEAIHDASVSGPVDTLRPRTYTLSFERDGIDSSAQRPIVIDTTALATSSTPCSPLELIDAATGVALPPGQATRYVPDIEGSWWQDSWSHSRSLGFRDSMTGAYYEDYPCFQLDPGSSSPEITWPSRLHTGWQELWSGGTLTPGKEYIMRLRPGGFVVPRWTFGTLENLKAGRAGPFNLPPLVEVEMDDVRFVCREWVDLTGNV